MRQLAILDNTAVDDISAALAPFILDAEETREAAVDAVIARQHSGFVMSATRGSEPAGCR
jgi:hypothetical protein